MSLAEVLVAMGIVAVIVTFSTTMIGTALRGTQDNINKQFATQKAVSMLEELRALVQTESGAAVVVLDEYDNGTTNLAKLTTRTDVTDPADPASGNKQVGGQWLFERRITVQRMRGANDVRLVNVKVYVRDVGGVRLLAEVAGVLSTIPRNMPPTQVYDVYLVAVENVPGWWVYMQNIRPFVEGAISDLQARHPGLEFRQHWIRALSYGRDPLYTPYVNRDVPSTSPIPSVYFYPGRMPDGSAVENYYSPDYFTGRVVFDGGTVKNGYDATSNPLPYSLADQYNNSMRYPEEKALFDSRAGTVIATSADGKETMLDDASSPTWRLLLDDMILRPDEYRNAIIINLHGELFPFPPVRNYADAAKTPVTMPNVRVVTHPERLTYGNGDDLALRVYSYHTNVTNPGAVADWMTQPITITLKGIAWTPVASDIVSITGGVDFDGDGDPDEYDAEPPTTTPQQVTAPTAMWYSSATDGTDTVITLHNSPLKSPCVTDEDDCDEGGLAADKRLYALEYIPSPVENLPVSTSPPPFETDLTDDEDRPKNTARWVIKIPSLQLPTNTESHLPITIETRIGTDTTTGYPNVSRTYVWRGTEVWLFGDANNDPHLPMTERFQILGDPRHCPYADLKLPHWDSGRVRRDRLGMGYNRYFDDFHAVGNNQQAAWPGWSYDGPPSSGTWFGIKNNWADGNASNDGWDSDNGFLEIDISRIYQVLRSAVMRTNAVYTTMTGFSYYYVGIGNEIGYDAANNFPDSIPVSSRPFDGTNGTRYEQSIIAEPATSPPTSGVKYIRENDGGNYWWAMTWLGELYPDDEWTEWSETGNLPTGTGEGNFSRVMRGSVNTARLPSGTTFLNAVRRPQQEGSTAFFWTGTPSATFHHRPQDGTTGSLAPDGTVVADTYKLPMPASIANARPFDLAVNDTSMNPDHFLQNVYGAPTTLTTLAQFYRHSTNIHGSSLLAMRDGNDASFVVVNGLSPTGESGVAFIARWSFLSLIQSYLTSGRYSLSGQPHPARVRELPRVIITSPGDDDDLVDPDVITVTWDVAWRRWDGLPYTPSYPDDFAEDTTVRYALLYSRDNGRTWLHMKDDTGATPGRRPAAPYLQTATSFNLNTPAAKFPLGNYLLRVEAYRDNGGTELPLHYSFHQFRAFIKRSS